jgi:hypothetical protein
VLSRAREGMSVYDAEGGEYGTVTEVFFGGASDTALEEGGRALAAPDSPLRRSSTIVGNVTGEVAGDDLPEEMVERLLREGYIRVRRPGLLAGDQFIVPDQIASVTEDGIHLRP